MFTPAFFQLPHTKRCAGNARSAGRSNSSKSCRRLLPYRRITRAFSSSSNSAMRSFSSASEKKVSLRMRARIQRCAICTPTSAFGLSRGERGRAGSTATP